MARAKAQPQRPPEPWFISDYDSLPDFAYGFPELPYGMTDDRPSGLRVLAKSLHLLALGWLATVAWLWVAQVQLNRHASTPRQKATAHARSSKGLSPRSSLR